MADVFQNYAVVFLFPVEIDIMDMPAANMHPFNTVKEISFSMILTLSPLGGGHCAPLPPLFFALYSKYLEATHT